MGPRLFSVENLIGTTLLTCGLLGFNGATLIQRGERSRRTALERFDTRFNGATLIQRGERQFDRKPHSKSMPLQWGHAYSAWRTADKIKDVHRAVIASMGPRLFSVENGIIAIAYAFPQVRFNGATLIQRGERQLLMHVGTDYWGFNGATLIQRGEPESSATAATSHK